MRTLKQEIDAWYKLHSFYIEDDDNVPYTIGISSGSISLSNITTALKVTGDCEIEKYDKAIAALEKKVADLEKKIANS